MAPAFLTKTSWSALAVAALVVAIVALATRRGRRDGFAVSMGCAAAPRRRPAGPRKWWFAEETGDSALNYFAFGDHGAAGGRWGRGDGGWGRDGLGWAAGWTRPVGRRSAPAGGYYDTGDDQPYFPRYGYYAGTRCVDLGNSGYRPCCATKLARGAYDSSCPTPEPY